MNQWLTKHILPVFISGSVLISGISAAVSIAITQTVIQAAPGERGDQGLPGEKGKNGASGTNGKDGINGKTAYEIAVEYGFTGSESDWLASLKGEESEAVAKGYLIVTDYLQANTGLDVSDELQRIISENPNRTIYFPDGVYTIAKPVATPGNPVNAVSFELSDFAVIKAADTWDSDEAMIRLGAAEPFNNITINGSNYSFFGGIVDGSGIAKGIAIESGRETAIRNVSIRNTEIGIHIKKGANGNSSDADIHMVNISGNNGKRSIGVYVEGFDNTFSNMRISGVKTGVKLESSSNYISDVHTLFFAGEGAIYEGSVGFIDTGSDNRFFHCSTTQYETGFQLGGGRSNYDACYSAWYNHNVNRQTAFKATGSLNSVITNCSADFREGSARCRFFVGSEGGTGLIIFPHFDTERNTSEDYKSYLHGEVLP
ncbi:MAG: hypothetical protein E7610_02410 [Ruminococcaceae bacterium]|nr:hypothetical protein [Oscillospiraceae bacterium]